MSINVNVDDYQIAQELLDNSKTLFASTSDEISSVMNTLDGQVLSYVKTDLANAKSTMSSMQETEKVISQDISTEVVSIKEIEAKAAEKANEIASTAAATGATTAEQAEPVTGNKNTISEFKEAGNALGDVLVSVGKGVLEVGASIVSAPINLLTGNLGGLFDNVKSIFNAAADIGKKVFSFAKEALEAIGHAFLSTAASIANLVMSLVEGIVSFVEAIVDAVVIVAGAVASLFTGLYDGINWIGSKIFGYEFNSATKAMWTKGLMPFVGTNWTGKAFDAIYAAPPFKWIEDKAFGPFKREGGIVYEIGKGVGYTVGIVLATVFTCGVAGGTSIVGALGSTGVSTAFAGLGAMGKNTQKGYNNLSEEEKQNGASIAKVLGYGAASGVIEGAAWYFTFGKGKNFYKGTGLEKALGASAKPFNSVVHGVNKVFGTSIKDFGAGNMAKVMIQFGKTYANASNKYVFLTDDQSVGGYFKDVWLNADNLTDAAIAGGVSLLYDATAGTYLKNAIEGKGTKIGNWAAGRKEVKISVKSEADLVFEGGGSSGDASAIASGGLLPSIKDAAADVISEGGLGKIYGGGVKKFYDFRNIIEMFASPE